MRKEVNISRETVRRLTKLGKEKNLKVKPFMEYVLNTYKHDITKTKK